MKKILALGLLICICACSSTQSLTVSNSEDAIFTYGEVTYTKQDLFDAMRSNDYSSTLLSLMSSSFVNKEGITQEELNALVDEELASYKESYGEYYEMMVSYYGGEEAMKENLSQNVALTKLVELYAEQNIETVAEEYKPLKAIILSFENEEEAKDVYTKLTTDKKELKEALGEYTYGGSTDSTLYTDKSSLDTGLKEALIGGAAGDYQYLATTTTDSSTNEEKNVYYIYKITDTDVKSFQDEFIEYYISITSDTTKIYNYFITKYNITMHDQNSYDLLSETYEVK